MFLRSINKFTSEQVIGLDISDASMEAVILDPKRKAWQVYSYARFRLSPGVIENGQILQPDKLKEDLKKMFTLGKPHAMRSNSVLLSLPDARIFTKLLDLPKNLKKKDLLLAAENKAAEYIPEDKENLLSVVKILSPQNGQNEVFYAAAPKGLVMEWVKVMESLGLDIIGFTMESISSFAGLEDSLKKEETLLLDIGSRHTNAVIFDAEGIRDSINISIAGDKITDAIATKLNISHLAAEEKKKTIGMDPSVDQGQVMWVIQGQMQPVADELKKFINFYEESHGRQVKKMILIGGSSQLKGLGDYFASNLNLPLLPIASIVPPKFLPQALESSKYINAFGLAKLSFAKSIELSFYQTERVDLQQRVTWQNLNLWLKVIFRKIGFIFSLLKRWYVSVPAILLILGLVFFWQQDKILSLGQTPSQLLSQEIVVSSTKSDQPNFILAQEKKVNIFLKISTTGLDYLAAEQSIKQQALAKAIGQAQTNLISNNFLVEEPIKINIVNLSPLPTEFKSGDNLQILAEYTFLYFDTTPVKNILLSELPSKKAAKLSQMFMKNLLFTDIIIDQKTNSLKLKVSADFVK